MPSLSELLSEFSDIKVNHVIELEPGVVIDILDTRVTPPKHKYHVVIGISDDTLLLGSVLINSELNTRVYNKIEEQYRCIKLKQELYSFLKWDSTVDCNQLFPLRCEGIRRHMRENPRCVLGKITPEDIEEMKLRMIEAPTISKEDKVKFGIIQN